MRCVVLKTGMVVLMFLHQWSSIALCSTSFGKNKNNSRNLSQYAVLILEVTFVVMSWILYHHHFRDIHFNNNRTSNALLRSIRYTNSWKLLLVRVYLCTCVCESIYNTIVESYAMQKIQYRWNVCFSKTANWFEFALIQQLTADICYKTFSLLNILLNIEIQVSNISYSVAVINIHDD